MSVIAQKKVFLPGLAASLIFLCSIFVLKQTTPHMAVATFSYLLLLWGLQFRHSHTQIHGAVMTMAIAIDLILVLTLQLQRSAVQTAVGEALSLAQRIHIFSSLTAVLLYVPALILGFRMLMQPELRSKYRAPHKRVAIATLVFRTIGFLTMFSMLGRGH